MVFFFFWLDVYGCVLSQSNHAHFQKGVDFSSEVLLLYVIFPKINRKPNSETERGKRHTRPPGQPRGEELSCRFLSHPVTLSQTGCISAAPHSQPLMCPVFRAITAWGIFTFTFCPSVSLSASLARITVAANARRRGSHPVATGSSGLDMYASGHCHGPAVYVRTLSAV